MMASAMPPGMTPHPAGPTPRARPGYLTARGRDLRIDLLRGLCVLVMVVDHVAGSSPLYRLTGGNRFFTSAAEGFILTSGLTAGLVYRRIVGRDGLAAATKKSLRRAFDLYLLAVGLALLVAPISELFHLPWAQRLDLARPLDFVVSVLTLHQTYYLADAMLLYTLLLALTPLALLLMERGHTRVVLLVSGLLWLLHQLFPQYASVTWPIAGNYLFTFSAWQFLFFGALALGYNKDRLPALTRRGQLGLHLLAGLGVVTLIALYVLLRLPAERLPDPLAGLRPVWDTLPSWIELNLFAKADLGPGRLVAAAMLFTFLYLSLTRWWGWLHHILQPLLLPFGQNALYAFTAHVVFAVAAPLALILLGLPRDAAWLNAAIQLAAVVLIWLLARQQFLGPAPKTRPYWRVSPFVMASLALIIMPWLPFEPASAQVIPVSDEILARARAYGTPVTSLEDSGFAASARADSAPPGTPTAPQPSAGGAHADEIARTATVLPAATTRSQAERARATATPTPLPPGDRSPAAAAPAAVPAGSAPPAAGTPAVETTAEITATVTVLPLPTGERLLVSEYDGRLAGHVYERSFYSELLRRDMRYWIYLPPDYGETGRRYPVLYALHGGGGGLEEWAAYGLFDSADYAFRQGILQPFIIVLPEGEKSFWANWSNDTQRWGDYLAYEVVWEVESHFAAIGTQSARGVAGNSMGGWGALYQGFTHPDIFGVVAAHSPSLYGDDGSLAFLGTGEEYASKNPLTLVRLVSGEHGQIFWMDIAETDPWVAAASELGDALQQQGVQYESRVYEGSHSPEYWASHVPEYLNFYARSLNRP